MEAKKLTYEEFRNELKKYFIEHHHQSEDDAEDIISCAENDGQINIVKHFYDYRKPSKDRYLPGLIATCAFNCG
jgi:hypothetical protein